jgi:hypothetical protein
LELNTPRQKNIHSKFNSVFSPVAFSPLFLLLSCGKTPAQSALKTGWNNPPNAARLRACWAWLNGNFTKESITHDLEGMKAKSFGGAVIIDANGADR